MRITHSQLTRNFLGRMNTNLGNLTKSNEKMSSQRAFNKGYEDVNAAGKALKLRKLITDNERYQNNIKEAQGRAAAAEDGLRTVNSLLIRAKDRVVEGLNGTFSQDDRNKIAAELKSAQDEVLKIMNVQFGDKYVYAAAGNKDGSPPFTVNDYGQLTYNGYVVDNLQKDPTTGKPSTYDDVTDTYTGIKWNEPNYIDIGFGYSMVTDPSDPNHGKVNANNGFKDTYSGVECFGYGRDPETGVPLNAYSLFGQMVANLEGGNLDELGDNLNAISDSMNYLLTSITEIGTRSVTLTDTLATLESEYINLADRQNDLEGVDLAEEIIYNKDFEMSWLVTLQLGSKILPQSIFDFLR